MCVLLRKLCRPAAADMHAGCCDGHNSMACRKLCWTAARHTCLQCSARVCIPSCIRRQDRQPGTSYMHSLPFDAFAECQSMIRLALLRSPQVQYRQAICVCQTFKRTRDQQIRCIAAQRPAAGAATARSAAAAGTSEATAASVYLLHTMLFGGAVTRVARPLSDSLMQGPGTRQFGWTTDICSQLTYSTDTVQIHGCFCPGSGHIHTYMVVWLLAYLAHACSMRRVAAA